MKFFLRPVALAFSLVLIGMAPPQGGSAVFADRKPKDANPDDHAFPALGVTAKRKVPVAWNQFYDYTGLSAILARLHRAFPDLTQIYSIGKSVEGRDLWCLEVTARKVGDPKRKPAMYIDGNIHGNEVQAGDVVAYTAWYLCHQYGQLDKVTELLDRNVFYLIPTINPDGRDRWFHHPQTTHSSRSGVKPLDNDQDGVADEDDFDDLDGDGSITQMRIKDPHGRFKPHPLYPEIMMEVGPEEKGEYDIVGAEGLDNDGDGRVNEDPVGGYDMNRNWAWDWQPSYIQGGAHEYPFSLPEPRAISEFIIDHPNIAAFQSYHNFGGMILRGPGREGGNIDGEDDRVLRDIAARGESMLPFYRSMVIYKDLYTVWGGEVDWLYNARGVLGFTSEIWSLRSLSKTPVPPGQERNWSYMPDEDQAAFLKYVLLNDGVVPWKPYNHPTYGPIEIGGRKKQWNRTPVSFLLEEECHRNTAFTLFHADQMPLLKISSVTTDRLQDNLYRVWVTLENNRMMPTRTQQDVRNHISPPDIVTLKGARVKVLSSGRVTDRFFKRVEPVKRRPERVELNSVRGMDTETVQFIVNGHGRFEVSVDSAKGGVLRASEELP